MSTSQKPASLLSKSTAREDGQWVIQSNKSFTSFLKSEDESHPSELSNPSGAFSAFFDMLRPQRREDDSDGDQTLVYKYKGPATDRRCKYVEVGNRQAGSDNDARKEAGKETETEPDERKQGGVK